MMTGFYTARTGLIYQQEHMNLLANNLANVNTVAYKSQRASFADLIYQNINRDTAENAAMIGHGVKINRTDLSMLPGGLEPTGYTFDFALLDDDTFFAIQNGNGDIYYTRAGNFILSNDGSDTFYLTTARGEYVLDEDGSEIEIEWDDDGELDFDTAQIGIYRFENPYGLTLLGDNLYAENAVSGEAQAIEGGNLRQGSLEKSGVELSAEMVKVIEASRAFSLNSRMVQVADEVEQTVNSLR